MAPADVDAAFPFPSYREHQRATLHQSAQALFDENGADTVVIDAPTGVGKSGINVALCRLADSAFYTTPQKQLRNQLQSDGDLQDYYKALRARADYYCPPGNALTDDETDYDCKTCPINRTPDKSCTDHSCPYWTAKEDAMDAQTAVLTFAYLIIDSRIPVETTSSDVAEGQAALDSYSETQISFDDRELLVVDEAHKLEEQVAGMHAGFSLSPYTMMTKPIEKIIEEMEFEGQPPIKLVDSLDDVQDAPNGAPAMEKPGQLYEPFNEKLQSAVFDAGDPGDVSVDDIQPALESVLQTAKGMVAALEKLGVGEDEGPLLDDLKGLVFKIEELLLPDLNDGREWVISIEDTVPNAPQPQLKAQLKPVKVDRFLQQYIWDRADKVVLSTATMPYRNNPRKWLSRLGLDSDSATVVSKPMPFSPENRPVRTDTTVAKMSNGGDERNWDAITSKLYSLVDRHRDEKGLVHTASYARARRLYETFEEHAVLHEDDDKDDEFYINKWQNSDKPMLLTPAMTDGVDLPGEMCRWQALLKVPYPTLSDPRVEYLVNVKNDWEWYMDVAARDVIQSVGRAVRSKDDTATYYVLDESFHDVIDGKAPEWFTKAVGV